MLTRWTYGSPTIEHYLMYANWPMWILNCIRPQIDIYLLLFAFSWKDLEKKNPEGWNNLVEVQLVGGFQMWCGGSIIVAAGERPWIS